MRNIYTLPRVGHESTVYRVGDYSSSWFRPNFVKPQSTIYSYMLSNLLPEIMQGHKCKIAQMFTRWLSRGVYSNPDKKYEYISFDYQTGMFTYIPSSKVTTARESDDDIWNNKFRQSMKPARFVKDLLNPRLTKRIGDHHFAKFATYCKVYMEKNKITISEESFDVGYSKENYHSCMAGKPVADFYNRFDTTLLVARNTENKMVGRAILWNDVTINEVKSKFLDRVYGNDMVHSVFAKYASDNNIPTYNTMVDDQIIVTKTIKDLKYNQASFIPYMDSFLYGMNDEQTISNNSSTRELRYRLDSTSGNPDDNGNRPGWIYDSYTCKYYPPKQFVTVDDQQYYIGDERITQINGQWYHVYDRRIITVCSGFLGLVKKHYLRSEGNYCSYSDDWYPYSDLIPHIDEDGREFYVSYENLKGFKRTDLYERSQVKLTQTALQEDIN